MSKYGRYMVQIKGALKKGYYTNNLQAAKGMVNLAQKNTTENYHALKFMILKPVVLFITRFNE